jgi:hypothetical protein
MLTGSQMGARIYRDISKEVENVEMAFYNVVRRLRLRQMREGQKRSQSQLTESGGPMVREGIEWSNFRAWKSAFMLCGGYQRRKENF